MPSVAAPSSRYREMRPGRFELPRSKRTTRPSTLRTACPSFPTAAETHWATSFASQRGVTPNRRGAADGPMGRWCRQGSRDSFPPAFPRDARSTCDAASRAFGGGLENRCTPFGVPRVRIPPPPLDHRRGIFPGHASMVRAFLAWESGVCSQPGWAPVFVPGRVPVTARHARSSRNRDRSGRTFVRVGLRSRGAGRGLLAQTARESRGEQAQGAHDNKGRS